jgi:hypothetical protein
MGSLLHQQAKQSRGTEFSCVCKLVYPSFPNTYAMQCMLKSNIYFDSQGRDQDQKNKFRTEESIGSLIDTKFVEHRTWLITTSINNALRTLLLKEMFNPGITSLRVSLSYQTTWAITMQTSCTTRFLVQPTATANQTRLLHSRVAHEHYPLMTQNFISNGPTASGWICHAEGL